jgi:hypothetical protein
MHEQITNVSGSWVLYLVLNGRGAIPGSRQFGLAVGETRVYEEPVALGTGEAFNRCHHLLPEIYERIRAHKIGYSGVVPIDLRFTGYVWFFFTLQELYLRCVAS